MREIPTPSASGKTMPRGAKRAARLESERAFWAKKKKVCYNEGAKEIFS